MGKVKKATKAYNRKNLNSDLEKRKEKRKLQVQINHTKNVRNAVKAAKGKAPSGRSSKEEEEESDEEKLDAPADFGEDMNVDEFMESGFDDMMEGSDEEGSEDGEGSEGEEDGEGSEEEGGEGSEDEEDGDEGTMASDIAKHKEALERLKQKDPEFFSFLEKEDRALLDFGAHGEEEEEEGLDGEEDGEDGPGEGEDVVDISAQDEELKRVTKATVDKWKKALEETHSLKAMRCLIGAFRVAVHMGDDISKDREDSEDRNPDGGLSNPVYKVATGVAYNAIVRLALGKLPEVFHHHLPVQQQKGDKGEFLPSTSKNWKNMSKSVNLFLKNLLYFLDTLTDPHMLTYALKHSLAFAPFVACLPKQGRAYLKTLLRLWTSEHETVRIFAFVLIRKLAIATPHPFLDLCLKGLYLTFVKNVKFTTVASLPMITFLRNSVVELCVLDAHSTYQHAFVYVRQLAIHLRNALLMKKKDSFAQVYNWQFVHCIRVWARVIAQVFESSDHSDKDVLRPLIYPLIQVTLGVINLIPTAKFFPLRFHCLKAILDVCRATHTFVPLSPLIFACLDSADMKKSPKASTSARLNIAVLIKVPKGDLGTRAFQDAVVENVNELALEYMSLYASNIGFPELLVPVAHYIRHFVKETKVNRFRKTLKQLLDKLEENARFITAERAKVAFSPKDTVEVASFERKMLEGKGTPLSRYFATWKTLDAKEKDLNEKRAAKEGPRPQEDSEEEAGQEDGEEEQEDGGKPAKKHVAKRKQDRDTSKHVKKSKSAEETEGDEDVLEDFNFSDEDD